MSKGRKPRDLQGNHWGAIAFDDGGFRGVELDLGMFPYANHREIRRLADWLQRAAEWIEGEEKGNEQT